MKNVIEQMLSRYEIKNVNDERNAMKEVLQEAILAGLAKADFFSAAAFYGGTALRIFYGLDRFSEDLDFSLLEPSPEFELTKYFSLLSDELDSLGLNFTVEEKKKSISTFERTAFVKGNTREHLLRFYPSNAYDVPYNELVNYLQDKPEGLDVSVLPTGSVSRLRFRSACGTPSTYGVTRRLPWLIDCSLPGLHDPGDVVVADVDGGIRIGMPTAAAMPACVSVSFP